MTDSAITSVCNAVFSDKDNPSFVDRQLQFKNATNKVDLETLPIGFVGEKICIDKKNSLAVEITRLFLDFEGSGEVTLYLYNTNSITPIETKVVTINSDHQEVLLKWKLDNNSDWYIGYYSDGLTCNALQKGITIMLVMNQTLPTFYLKKPKFKTIQHQTCGIYRITRGMSETTGMNLDVSVYL